MVRAGGPFRTHPLLKDLGVGRFGSGPWKLGSLGSHLGDKGLVIYFGDRGSSWLSGGDRLGIWLLTFVIKEPVGPVWGARDEGSGCPVWGGRARECLPLALGIRLDILLSHLG